MMIKRSLCIVTCRQLMIIRPLVLIPEECRSGILKLESDLTSIGGLRQPL